MFPALDIPPFLLVANHLALELVNTVNGRPDWHVDYLPSPAHVAAWAEQLEIVGPTERHPIADDAHASDFSALIELRELLFRIFSETSLGINPSPGNFHRLLAMHREGLDQADWELRGGRLTPSWPKPSLRTLRYRVSHDATQLLLLGDLSRVRACAGCGWLFLDTSKGGARKWCTMNLCGAKDKMRRYRGAT